MGDPNPFDPEVLAAVAGHMNHDHTGDSLTIVRALGGVPDASAAEVVKLDETGVDFFVTVGDEQRTIRLTWTRPIRERQHFRREFVRMYHEAAGGDDLERNDHPRTQ